MRRLDHVGVVVDDLDAATAFFAALESEGSDPVALHGGVVDGVLGMRGVESRIVAVRAGADDPWLEPTGFLAPRDDGAAEATAPTRPGLRHVPFEVDDLDGPLAASGVVPLAGVMEHDGVHRPCCLRGPEGLLVEPAQRIDGGAAGSVGRGGAAARPWMGGR